MISKWLSALFLLMLTALILTWLITTTGISSTKTSVVESDIQSALSANGYDYVDVDMYGNVATLSGVAPSESSKSAAISLAETVSCSQCKGEGIWHVVKDDMTFQTLPIQTPYTFSAVKESGGSVTLSGFVPSEVAKADIILAANRIFNTKVIDRTIRVANGAPDANFLDVTEGYMKELALLDKGRFSQEGYAGLISGTASDISVRERINQIGQSLPGDYGTKFAANIDVPEMSAQNVGQVQSETICQTLFDDLKTGNRILFETGRADIKGASSFDLLNKLASAANQCDQFRVKIDGHTDNVGDPVYNQRLSEQRAASVKNYLSRQDVEADRLTIQGFGEREPRSTNETPEGRALNRRISFTLTRAQ